MDHLGGLISSIFWLFIILAAIYPLFQKKNLEAARLRALQRLEKKRGTRAIALIHRQETMSLLGFPLMRFINIDDSEEVLRAIRLTPKDMPLDIIIHTPGGLVLATEQIANALKRHQAKVTVFVPHYAMSGGTLIALAADEIVMDENAVLGPVDPQLGEYPAASIIKAVQIKGEQNVDDETLILADVAEKARKQVFEYVKGILSGKLEEKKAEEIANAMTEGRWTHDYPITADEAKKLGLPVTVGLPEEVYEIMGLYPQTAQRRPSVQYIPIPYRRTQREQKGEA